MLRELNAGPMEVATLVIGKSQGSLSTVLETLSLKRLPSVDHRVEEPLAPSSQFPPSELATSCVVRNTRTDSWKLEREAAVPFAVPFEPVHAKAARRTTDSFLFPMVLALREVCVPDQVMLYAACQPKRHGYKRTGHAQIPSQPILTWFGTSLRSTGNSGCCHNIHCLCD